MKATRKTWFITGASKGIGLVLTKRLLAQGYQVAATSRDLAALKTAVGEASNNFLALEVDLMNETSIRQAITTTVQTFGHIDVLVNNAGYGQMGAIEELSDAESRRNFDVNVFGLLNVIRQIMPQLREQGHGHIFNISSIGGYHGGFDGWGIYCATKFAVSAITEALSSEAKSFGINTTLVYPGYFRTNFLNKDSVMTPAHPIAAYTSARQSQQQHEDVINGNQPGDPEKLAEVLIKTSEETEPVLHLFLGQDAYAVAKQKIQLVEQDLQRVEALATATGF